MKLIAYLRVSTDKQAEHGLGLAVQERAIRAWARAEGHKILAWHKDQGISGSNGLDTREGLAEAFRELESGSADGLVVYRLDRLARKLASQETWIERLEQRGRKVLSVTEPEYGEDETRTFVRQVLGAVAEYERAVINRRMQSGRALKAERGGYAYGSPAYGLKAIGGELQADEAEQRGVDRIAELKAAGASVRQIAATLNGEGIPTKRGGQWQPESVARVVRRLNRA